MKKLLILILILFLSITAKSQTYIPFPDSNAVWKEVWYTNPPQYYSQHYEYITDGDTLIYNTLYTKIKKIEYNVFCSLDTLNIEYAGAFRNDTVNKKVYYMQVFPFPEKILYDFSLDVGDTVPDSFQNLLYPSLTVKEIDTVYINNEPRKRYQYWLGPNHLGYQFFVYEGFGADLGLLEYYSVVEFYYYLKCFHNDNILEYMHPGDTTCILKTDTCLINSMEIVPDKVNPSFNIYLSNDQIVISHDYDLRNLSIDVYDLRGIILFRVKVNSDITFLEKNDFHNGLYIFILKGDNIFLDNKKLFINQ